MKFVRVVRKRTDSSHLPDWESQDAIVEVKMRPRAIRAIRDALLQLTYYMRERSSKRGYLLLIEPGITDDNLKEEWLKATGVLQADIANYLFIVTLRNDNLAGIPSDPDIDTQEELKRISLLEAPPGKPQLAKPDYSAEILKLLIYHWILNSDNRSKWLDQYSQSIDYPKEMKSKTLTSTWLAKAVGCTFRPVSNTLDEIGTAVIRYSDKSVRLKYFPRYAWEKLLVLSDKSRMTMRFADSSGQPRSPESLLKRLRSLKRQDIGVGGVSGARRIYPNIDLIGTPQLDLTLHCPGELADISFIRQLDPALKRQESRNTSASLVIHFLRRNKSYFKIEKDGSVWADPVECLLDLQEVRLESQALEFRNAIAPKEETGMKDAMRSINPRAASSDNLDRPC